MTRSIDHTRPGTPEWAWRDGRLDHLPRLEVPAAGDRLLVVAAHPDDESLGAGGLIAAAVARGAEVRVIVATDGEASHPESSTHTPSQLATIRRAEVTAGLAQLAPSVTPKFLGFPDGDLAAQLTALTTALTAYLVGCTHVATPWSGDRHPDHEACARAVTAAIATDTDIRHWQYPIWTWHWGDPSSSDLPQSQLRRVDLWPEELSAKRAALSCHRSQHTALSDAPGDEAILPAHVLVYFERDFECFIVDTAPAAAAGYFDRLYGRSDDPWGLADRFYERRKRELLLASLPRPRFRRAFEPGCATGQLTAQLAQRCDRLTAWDGAASAVQQTRSGLAETSNVQVEQRRIPQEWPNGSFDLVVISEVGYYCIDLDELADRVHDCLAADGVVLACHWRRKAADHPHPAEAVHAVIGAGLYRIIRHEEADFLLEVWSRSNRSVAAEEGIVA